MLVRVHGDTFILLLSDSIVNQLSASNVFRLLVIEQTAYRFDLLEVFNRLEIAYLFYIYHGVWFQS